MVKRRKSCRVHYPVARYLLYLLYSPSMSSSSSSLPPSSVVFFLLRRPLVSVSIRSKRVIRHATSERDEGRYRSWGPQNVEASGMYVMNQRFDGGRRTGEETSKADAQSLSRCGYRSVKNGIGEQSDIWRVDRSQELSRDRKGEGTIGKMVG